MHGNSSSYAPSFTRVYMLHVHMNQVVSLKNWLTATEALTLTCYLLGLYLLNVQNKVSGRVGAAWECLRTYFSGRHCGENCDAQEIGTTKKERRNRWALKGQEQSSSVSNRRHSETLVTRKVQHDSCISSRQEVGDTIPYGKTATEIRLVSNKRRPIDLPKSWNRRVTERVDSGIGMQKLCVLWSTEAIRKKLVPYCQRWAENSTYIKVFWKKTFCFDQNFCNVIGLIKICLDDTSDIKTKKKKSHVFAFRATEPMERRALIWHACQESDS